MKSLREQQKDNETNNTKTCISPSIPCFGLNGDRPYVEIKQESETTQTPTHTPQRGKNGGTGDITMQTSEKELSSLEGHTPSGEN